jgi:hypothetical protein
MLPFSIVGSEEEIEIEGEPVRARIYPWGIVEVDNPKHSDFSRLRNALLNTHLADLKSLTHDMLYETYRTEKLSRTVHADSAADSSILPEELATQSVRLKEEQLRKEEEKLREIELKVQREINEKRQELLAKEESLRCVLAVACRGRTRGADGVRQEPGEPPRGAGLGRRPGLGAAWTVLLRRAEGRVEVVYPRRGRRRRARSLSFRHLGRWSGSYSSYYDTVAPRFPARSLNLFLLCCAVVAMALFPLPCFWNLSISASLSRTHTSVSCDDARRVVVRFSGTEPGLPGCHETGRGWGHIRRWNA